MEQLIADIERLRQVYDLSKRELANKAEIDEGYYWRIVTNKAPGVSYSIIQRLAEAVGVTLMHYIDPKTVKAPEKIKPNTPKERS